MYGLAPSSPHWTPRVLPHVRRYKRKPVLGYVEPCADTVLSAGGDLSEPVGLGRQKIMDFRMLVQSAGAFNNCTLHVHPLLKDEMNDEYPFVALHTLTWDEEYACFSTISALVGDLTCEVIFPPKEVELLHIFNGLVSPIRGGLRHSLNVAGETVPWLLAAIGAWLLLNLHPRFQVCRNLYVYKKDEHNSTGVMLLQIGMCVRLLAVTYAFHSHMAPFLELDLPHPCRNCPFMKAFRLDFLQTNYDALIWMTYCGLITFPFTTNGFIKLSTLVLFFLVNLVRTTVFGGAGQFYYAVGRLLLGFTLGDILFDGKARTDFQWGQCIYATAFVYFFAAACKLAISGPGWASGEIFKVMIHMDIAKFSRGATDSVYDLFLQLRLREVIREFMLQSPALLGLANTSGLLLEFCLAGVLWRKSRLCCVGLIFLFMGSIAFLFPDILSAPPP